MKTYRIRVRLGAYNYDVDEYNAINIPGALEMMRDRIWFKYQCFNPEVISVTEV